MDDYAGRVLADRYRLPLPPADEYELAETRAFDTYSGQEVLVRQVPLPEVVEAEVLDADGLPDGFVPRRAGGHRSSARTARQPADPAVRRAIEAAQAAARIPDHPRLDQVFDVFAEGGSLWVVSELVSARPLAALLAERPLSPYRAAEVAADVLAALRVLHAHGWVHRNITSRTVLVCDDGRVMLTGLAAGAAEEALCGYDPVPPEEGEDGAEAHAGHGAPGTYGPGDQGQGQGYGPASGEGDGSRGYGASGYGPDGLYGVGGGRPALPEARTGEDGSAGARPADPGRAGTAGAPAGPLPAPGAPSAHASGQAPETGGDIRAARAGAIAAYRAGARAAARVQEAQQAGRDAALPAPRPRPLGGGSVPEQPDASGAGRGTGAEAASPPGRIADPYGVAGRTNPWHGAMPRPGAPAAGGGNGGGTDAGGRSRGELPGPGTTVPGPHGGGGEGRPGAPVGGAGTNRHSGHAGPGGPDVLGGPPAQRQYHDELQGPYGGAPDVPWTGAAHHGGPGALAPAAPSGHASEGTAASWDQPASAPRRGPATALAAERARQARMAVVGPVTERWAPEQAGPVHENWQLAAPIGPATDLWALGALLFRAVQGHAPYPEESTAELVQLVCSEPPAFAEECGPLRPVVESLLRQDPTERIDFEELNGWLRSLVRSAPEPDAGTYVVPVPPPPSDPARLPIVRRRGELVRRRRAGLPDAHGRHKRSRQERPAPRRLGRTLLLLILLALAGAVAYAVAFMPKAGTDDAAGGRTGTAGSVSPDPGHSSDAEGNDEGQGGSDEAAGEDGGTSPSSSSAQSSQTTGAEVAQGFSLRKDAEGFRVAVASGWDRAPRNGQGQVVYSKGDFELIVVPGRDSTGEFGDDPMEYQRERERELQPFRDSTWATSSGMRTVEVGGRTMVEGQFTWQDADGQEVYVRNLAMVVDGRYHVVQVRGPEAERDEVTRLYEQASTTYQVTGG